MFAHGRFVKVGRHYKSLFRSCDLRVFGDSLISVHATRPLDFGGASVLRFRPADDPPFTVLFDWSRPGEPERGGADGQGFLRARAIGGRLLVPDSDPPYVGFGLARQGPEGYVFVSDGQGLFARQRNPGHLPPAAPQWPAGEGGAAVLPGAIHVLDVIRYRGRLYASTGWMARPGTPYLGSPAALQVADPAGGPWSAVVRFPQTPREGVWRFTFLTRFRDRLYAGLQDFYGREADYVVFELPAGREVLESGDARAVHVTEYGQAQTVRWYADRGTLYWIASDPSGSTLRSTTDGETWRTIEIPAAAGAPTDIVRFRDALVVMTERQLLRWDGAAMHAVATVEEGRTPFPADDFFCAAPLAVFGNRLFVGGQRDGALYEVVADSP